MKVRRMSSRTRAIHMIIYWWRRQPLSIQVNYINNLIESIHTRMDKLDQGK